MKHFISCLLLLTPLFVLAQAPATLQDGAIGMLSFNENKLVSLAEAIPADKFSWRPAEGVRSIEEAFMHLAAANYFMFMQTGVVLPEGINPMSMEADVKGKENVIEAIKASLAFGKEQIGAITDDQLTEEVKMPFPGEFNKQSVIMICLDHCAEHMGQIIAYARMNGVAPPWSQAQEDGE